MEDQSDDECEEAEIIMPTKEELIYVSAGVGFHIEDLIRAEEEIVAAETGNFSSPSSARFKYLLASKIINVIVRERSLQHQGKTLERSIV
jgi:hypothetical protein